MRPLKNPLLNLPIKNPTQTSYIRFKRGINTMPDTMFDRSQKDAHGFMNDRLKTEYTKEFDIGGAR